MCHAANMDHERACAEHVPREKRGPLSVGKRRFAAAKQAAVPASLAHPLPFCHYVRTRSSPFLALSPCGTRTPADRMRGPPVIGAARSARTLALRPSQDPSNRSRISREFAAPASAQPLVDVDIRNVLNNNTVQITVPVNAAVAICADVDVNVAILLAAIADPDVNTFNCDARANQDVTITA